MSLRRDSLSTRPSMSSRMLRDENRIMNGSRADLAYHFSKATGGARHCIRTTDA